MSLFRPCIDLHDGKVKQIVGGTLSDSGSGLKTNFESERGADYFAGLYRRDGLSGGHVIMLGRGNDDAALSALRLRLLPSGSAAPILPMHPRRAPLNLIVTKQLPSSCNFGLSGITGGSMPRRRHCITLRTNCRISLRSLVLNLYCSTWFCIKTPLL